MAKLYTIEYVCMYICMYICMYVCMYICMYICMYVCMYVCMYACMYACMYICMYVLQANFAALKLFVECIPSPLTYSTAYELICCILTQCIVARVKPVYSGQCIYLCTYSLYFYDVYMYVYNTSMNNQRTTSP